MVDPEARDNPPPPPPPPPDAQTSTGKRRSTWLQKLSSSSGAATPSGGSSTPFGMSSRRKPGGSKRDETTNLREAVDAFRARERALLAQIETQKAAFDAREAALRFQLSEAARRENDLRQDLSLLHSREASLARRLADLERRATPATPGTPGTAVSSATMDGDLSPRSKSAKYRSKWAPAADVGEDLAAARKAENDAQRPRNLRDLEQSFKPRGNPFRKPGSSTPQGSPTVAGSPGAKPPRSPNVVHSPKPPKAITPPPGSPQPPRHREPMVEKAVSELIEKDRAREGDVQRMLEMVANLQAEMSALKRENELRGDRPPSVDTA